MISKKMYAFAGILDTIAIAAGLTLTAKFMIAGNWLLAGVWATFTGVWTISCTLYSIKEIMEKARKHDTGND